VPALKNRIGETFGKLTVIERAENINGRVAWLCECECGKPAVIRSGDLTRKDRPLTCGKCNDEYHATLYEFKNGYVVGHVRSGRKFLIDEEDLLKVKDYSMTVTEKGYVHFSRDGESIGLHRYLMNPDEDEIVDHKNRKTWDNRKKNLRVCNYRENTKNRSPGRNNISGIIGVFFHKRNKRWAVQICVDYQQIYLGSYKTKKEAIKVRLQAEKEYFKEFAPQSHLFEEYNIT
jgi:hypothetical protein